MKKTIKYSEEPIGDIKIIEDFLPSPENLVLKDNNVKVTISLTKESVDFFKAEAKKHHTQYQKMIRNLLDVYANNHSASKL
ncbi:MAG TPA: CopG family transcriptional regulator [Campylobacterales bacterium]|nr:CopG family transcriptional regulator [Campylobacterales bacterium]